MRFCRHCGYSDRDVRFDRDMETEARKVVEMFHKLGDACAEEMFTIIRKYQKEALHRAGVKDARNILYLLSWDNLGTLKRKLQELCKQQFGLNREDIMPLWSPKDGGKFMW